MLSEKDMGLELDCDWMMWNADILGAGRWYFGREIVCDVDIVQNKVQGLVLSFKLTLILDINKKKVKYFNFYMKSKVWMTLLHWFLFKSQTNLDQFRLQIEKHIPTKSDSTASLVIWLDSYLEMPLHFILPSFEWLKMLILEASIWCFLVILLIYIKKLSFDWVVFTGGIK